jgi:WD40 repeat protein
MEPVRLGQAVKPVAAPSLHRTSITFSPDGKKVAWVFHQADRAANDGGGLVIHYWDLEKRLALSEMKAATDFTFASSPLRFTPNGRMLVLGCFQLTTECELLAKPGTVVRNNVRVWLTASGKELPFAQRENGTVKDSSEAVAVTPDGKSVVAIDGKSGRVWGLPDGKAERRFSFEPATKLVVSAEGKLAAGTVGEDTVKVWNTADGKEAAQFPGGGRALGLSAAGKQLAAISSNLLSLWDVSNGKLVWTVPAKLASDEGFGFSADGKRLAWNEDGKITVADAATGKAVRTITATPGPLAFSPDGKRLALACPDGTALAWELEK